LSPPHAIVTSPDHMSLDYSSCFFNMDEQATDQDQTEPDGAGNQIDSDNAPERTQEVPSRRVKSKTRLLAILQRKYKDDFKVEVSTPQRPLAHGSSKANSWLTDAAQCLQYPDEGRASDPGRADGAERAFLTPFTTYFTTISSLRQIPAAPWQSTSWTLHYHDRHDFSFCFSVFKCSWDARIGILLGSGIGNLLILGLNIREHDILA
jgi:hypothetical protein